MYGDLARTGSFVGIYKLLLNALPILLPQPNSSAWRSSSRARSSHSRSRSRSLLPSLKGPPPDSPFAAENEDDDEDEDDIELAIPEARRGSRHARLSVSAQAHQVWVRKKTRRWYAVIAGAVAGAVAILCEKRDRRVGIAQQMFVRWVVSV